MKTTKINVPWKRGLSTALAVMLLLLCACGAKTDVGNTAAPDTAAQTVPMTTEAPVVTEAPETIRATEAPAVTEPVVTEAATTEPLPTEPTEFIPDPEWPSGSCGDDLNWYFNEKTGELTIAGTGDMDDFEKAWTVKDESARWAPYAERIRSVTLMDGVTSIGDNVFYNLRALQSVTIPDSVTRIGTGAFRACKGLKELTISAGVTELGEEVFDVCLKMEAIRVDPDNPNFSSLEGVLFNKAQTELIRYPVGKTSEDYHIPEGVTEIAAYAFDGQIYLSGVTIPDSVIVIDDYAFNSCSLTSVTIGSGVTTIGKDAFLFNYLEEVTIPENVVEIGAHAFGYAAYDRYMAISGFKIHGVQGSAAETYAEENGMIFVAE